jgi:radical SAM protein with 4Fe4S-binding SPASM domain
MREMGAKALALGVPLGVHLDLTYRCNERCIHCYLDHKDHGEMSTAEILGLLEQLAEAGVFFLTLSGGEIMLRRDFMEIMERARALAFCVKLKTNAVLVKEPMARRIAELGVESVQISVYSDRPEVHDGITKLPGSLKRSIQGARMLQTAGVKVIFANVLMRQNAADYAGVRALAEEVGAEFTMDPTITPMMDGDQGILSLNVDADLLKEVFRDSTLVGNADDYCLPPAGPMAAEDAMDTIPCSAGHTACYISPYGDLYPCVQFPLPSGNVRQTKFVDLWKHSPQLKEVRSITLGDLQGCSSCVHQGGCTRCPGLAYMEGNMRGPSIQDCEKSFARTGVPSVNLQNKQKKKPAAQLVQIQILGGAGCQPAAGWQPAN